jgi:hypothetical protein
MAGDAFQKVGSGETLRIPAEAYNAFIDAALDLRRRGQGQASEAKAAPLPSGQIMVRNDSGADRNRFEVLGIASPIFLPSDDVDAFKNAVALACGMPSAPGHKGRFVILAEPIPAGKPGRAWVAGACPVRLQIDKEDDKYADITDGNPANLTSCTDGAAAILWKEGFTGEVWAVVRFPAGGGGGLPRWQPAPT